MLLWRETRALSRSAIPTASRSRSAPRKHFVWQHQRSEDQKHQNWPSIKSPMSAKFPVLTFSSFFNSSWKQHWICCAASMRRRATTDMPPANGLKEVIGHIIDSERVFEIGRASCRERE